MTLLRALPLCLFLIAAISYRAAAQTQATNHDVTASESQSFQFAPARNLRPDVDAWPLLANATSSAAKRVNAILAAKNRQMMSALKECDAAIMDFQSDENRHAKRKTVSADDWARTVNITMTGPRFVSLVATDGFFCGGAHPDSDTEALVFDMTTGELVDWTAHISKSSQASPYADSVSDKNHVAALVLPGLEEINLANTSAECKDAFDDQQSFLIWPDAGSGRLVAEPFDLPHVMAPCDQEIDLTMEQARKLGFDETILSAIEQAHRQIETNPKHESGAGPEAQRKLAH